MTEPESKRQYDRLLAAFGRPFSEGGGDAFADEFRRGLSGFDAHEIRTAVDMCIQNEKNFPRIATMRKYALDARARTASISRRQQSHDADAPVPTCPACQSYQLYVALNGRYRPLHDWSCYVAHPADILDQRAALEANCATVRVDVQTPLKLAPRTEVTKLVTNTAQSLPSIPNTKPAA